MAQREITPSQAACYVLLTRLVTCVDIVNGTKAKSPLSLHCSPRSRTIIDKAYYTNVSRDICGPDCQPTQFGPNASCHPYEDTDVCGLLLPVSDVSLLYSSCYADNASCVSETFNQTSRRENISLFFLCSDGDAVDPCNSDLGESSTLFHHFAAPALQTNVTCTCEVEIKHLVEGSSIAFTYLVFDGVANTSTEYQVSPSVALTLSGSRKILLNTSTYPLSGELPVLARTLRIVVTLRVTGQEQTSARFWLRFEKRAKTECRNGKFHSEVYPDPDHDTTIPEDTKKYHWTSAGVVAIVSGLSAVAATILLVICATKQCVLFRPRKRRPVCLEPLPSVTTFSTDNPVSQTEASVAYYVDQSTTDTSPDDVS